LDLEGREPELCLASVKTEVHISGDVIQIATTLRDLLINRESKTVAELAREFVPVKAERIASGQAFEIRFRLHILPRLGHHTNRTLRKSTVEEWMGVLSGDGLSPQTVNHCRDGLRQLIEWAIDDDLWDGRNPAARAGVLEVDSREKGVMNAKEAARFLRCVPDPWRPLFVTAVWLGPRRGELFGLLRSELNLDEKLISFNHSHDRPCTKTRNRRANIPIPNGLVGWLKTALARTKNSVYLFPNSNGGMLSRDSKLADVTRQALEASGMGERQITFHGLRRVSSTLHQEAGCHPWVVSKVLGHSQASLAAFGSPVENMTAKKYTAFTDDYVRRELNKLKLKI
jgi:integrase